MKFKLLNIFFQLWTEYKPEKDQSVMKRVSSVLMHEIERSHVCYGFRNYLKTFFLFSKFLINKFGIFIAFLIILTPACSKIPQLDYEELTAEELEILYNVGHSRLLPLVCKSYGRLYLESIDEEWRIYGPDYKKEVESKLLSYCKKSFDVTGSKSAACNLKAYYKSLLEEDIVKLPQYILFLTECNSPDTDKQNLINNDSKMLAIVEHALCTMDRLSKTSDFRTMQGQLGKTSEIFGLYLTDLEALKNNLAFLTAQIDNTIETFQYIKTTLEYLQNSYSNMSSIQWENSDTLKENFRFKSVILDLHQNLEEFVRAVIETSQQINNYLETNHAQYPPKVSSVIKAIILKKKRYLKGYNIRFQELSG